MVLPSIGTNASVVLRQLVELCDHLFFVRPAQQRQAGATQEYYRAFAACMGGRGYTIS